MNWFWGYLTGYLVGSVVTWIVISVNPDHRCIEAGYRNGAVEVCAARLGMGDNP